MANISQNWQKGVSPLIQVVHFKILFPYTSDYSLKSYASALAKQSGISQRTAVRRMQEFSDARLLDIKIEGRNKLFFFNLDDPKSLTALTLLEEIKGLTFLQEYPKLAVAITELMGIGDLLIFGSYAKGIPKEDSDLDVVMFAKKKKNLASMLQRYPYKINIQHTTEEQFQKEVLSGNRLAAEIARNHISFGNTSHLVRILIQYFRRPHHG